MVQHILDRQQCAQDPTLAQFEDHIHVLQDFVGQGPVPVERVRERAAERRQKCLSQGRELVQRGHCRRQLADRPRSFDVGVALGYAQVIAVGKEDVDQAEIGGLGILEDI